MADFRALIVDTVFINPVIYEIKNSAATPPIDSVYIS